MLGDIDNRCSRTVSRISTASREYGFSRLATIGPGASVVTRVRSPVASYRNASWTRISRQRAAAGRVVQTRLGARDHPQPARRSMGGRCRREPLHELADRGLDLAPEQEPA